MPILLIAAVALATVVSAAGEDTRTGLEYVDEMQDQAVELAKSGDALREVVSRLQRIDRDEFVTVIDEVQSEINTGLAFVEGPAPNEKLIAARALYVQALEAWEEGVLGYQASVLQAADEPASSTVVDVMAQSLAELRAGDNLYADLVEVMSADGIPPTSAPMPAVALLPAEGPIASLSVSYVDSARSQNSQLALRPGLRVSQVASNPEWQVSPEDVAVIPATREVVFAVVVTNAGNVTSDATDIVLTLTGGEGPQRVQAPVESLRPGRQVTVIFDPIDVAPGVSYEVTAALAPTRFDADQTDNELSVRFTVNDG